MKIVAAAIEYQGKVYSLPAPNRHYHVIRFIHEECKVPMVQGVQGFLTDEGKFVDRREAGRIAIEAGQLVALPVPPDLYTEDLW